MKAGYLDRPRTKESIVRAIYANQEAPHWLWWNLQRERLACQDLGEDDSLWYTLICRTLDALNVHDWPEVSRCIGNLAESIGVTLSPEDNGDE